MAKLLIIDDQIPMVKLIQQYMVTINPRFTPENTFCFSEGADHKIALGSLGAAQEDTGVVPFPGKKEKVTKQVLEFLSEHQNECVLILIDVLLCSLDIKSPNTERYRADNEYSCELYSKLLQAKNKNPEAFFFHILYSRSEASLFRVIVPILKQIHDSMSEDDKKYFPLECCHPENVSWCKNSCEQTDEACLVDSTQENHNRPLILPDSYRKFIGDLN